MQSIDFFDHVVTFSSFHFQNQPGLWYSRCDHEDHRHHCDGAAKGLDVHPAMLENCTCDGVADEEANACGKQDHADASADDADRWAEGGDHSGRERDKGPGEESLVLLSR